MEPDPSKIFVKKFICTYSRSKLLTLHSAFGLLPYFSEIINNMPRKSTQFYEVTYETTTVCVIKLTGEEHFNIYPYLCNIDPNGYLVSVGRILADEEPAPDGSNEINIKIAEFAANIELQALTEKFTDGKIKQASLFEEADKKLMDTVIKPYYDKNFTEITQLIRENNIPVYKHNALPHLYEADRIILEEEPAETLLKFARTDDGTSYTLTASHKGEPMDLMDENNAIITIDPCLLLYDDRMIVFDGTINGNLLRPFLKKESIEIPKRIEKDYFARFIRKMVSRCEVEAEGFRITNLQLEPKAILTPTNDWQNNPVLELSFDYGDKNILPGSPGKNITVMGSDKTGFVFSRVKRDMVLENKMQKKLKEMGLQQKASTFSLPGSETIYNLMEWLINQYPEIAKAGFELKQHPEKEYILSKATLKSGIKTGLDWFDLNVKVDAGSFSFPFVKLRQNILDGNREYVLPSGEIFLIPEEWMTEYSDLMTFAESDTKTLRVKKHHYMLLRTFGFPEVEELARLAETAPKAELPKLNNVNLRPYQITGYQKITALQSNGFGAILADDMGLGKTLQVITIFADTYPQGNGISFDKFYTDAETGPKKQLDLFADFTEAAASTTKKATQTKAGKSIPASLVVMPTSLVHNWYYELRRFAPWLSIHVYTGPKRKMSAAILKRADVILTSYGILRNDIDKLEAFNFSMVVLDESQQIKNPSSATAKAVLRIKGKKRIAMSGTPIENRISDLWPQMQFANPGILGSLSAFQKEFGSNTNTNNQKNAYARLKTLISPFIIRRTKAEVAPELPPITESIAWCTMTDDQQGIYEKEKSGIRNALLAQSGSDEKPLNQAYALQALMKLRQIACHPELAGFDTTKESGKFEEVTRKLETLLFENHKVLIFSSFVKHLEIYEEWCKERDIKYAKLTGATTNREKAIDAFKKDDETQLFFISLKAGGVGLNLPEAGYVFLLDPWWNPAAESQAINRAHRIGQDKNVFVYRFISTGTVEEKIIRLQNEKSQMAEAVIESDAAIEKLSREEMQALFE